MRSSAFLSIAPMAVLLSVALAGVQTAAAAVSTKKSISAWVSCTGTADDTAGAIKAFAAARNAAFTLVVDCPVRLHSGAAIDRAIFIDNSTSVEFTAAGKFFVDNVLHPAFVIANSSDISLTNWNVEWDGSLPIEPHTGGYILGAKSVASAGLTPAAGAFNDIVLTNWLQANRAIVFNQTKGSVRARWAGPANAAAVFYITGDSTSLVFNGIRVYAPPSAGGDRFIPTVFSMTNNWKSGQIVDATTPLTAQHAAVPHLLVFSGIALDGILMGWLGGVRDATFDNITSERYGDLQDAKGGNVGGVGKWFSPPHLLYLSDNAAGDPALSTANVDISNVFDWGPRIGVARDKGGADTISGYAPSLKLGCNGCTVTGYTTTRPDGFMDVLPSTGLTVSNVFGVFDSAFLNNLYTAGIRFPSSGYSNVAFQNVTLEDSAESTLVAPVGNARNASNAAITFANFKVSMNRWAGSDYPLPTIAGLTNTVALNVDMSGQLAKLSHLLKDKVSATLYANPATVHPGGSTLIGWRSAGALTCSGSGAWSGPLSPFGGRVVKLATAGNYDFTVTCQNGSNSAATVMRVTSQ